MPHFKVKIHDVLHDPRPDNPRLSSSDIETRIEQYVVDDSLQNVRIMPGYRNSPIFIELKRNTLTTAHVKRIAEQVVRQFSEHVDGVDVDKTIVDDNLRLLTPASTSDSA